MKSGVTLIETLISLLIATILFSAIFGLTQLSLFKGHQNMKLQVSLTRELAAIAAYDKAKLAGEEARFPSFLSEPKHEVWGLTAESSLGYQGVLLP
jgi:prepilin-type N-terminal cleavage/methylation domain-containing protein